MHIPNIGHVIIFNSCCFYSDQLDPIVSLVSSWQKMEFESWPTLLDEVQARFDTNAGQLWFPLHSVLEKCSVDAHDTMQRSLLRLPALVSSKSVFNFFFLPWSHQHRDLSEI
ncbi:hypothetical protein HanXRQr2_Chr11g0497971 [Helianthus annuus]|uniref:Uncharacterized protein n=1 Tax=Helianthus annuus TaxID=4232 RepID=A0A9K3HQF5_HELAN|nr:hypothetical protein HanXRQr2_Chr11g0497971 [Helianthus annuus]KAJ0875727.1 hypothetical protein HanPSC8_Chr11g0479931 [Helianthus annuus]